MEGDRGRCNLDGYIGSNFDVIMCNVCVILGVSYVVLVNKAEGVLLVVQLFRFYQSAFRDTSTASSLAATVDRVAALHGVGTEYAGRISTIQSFNAIDKRNVRKSFRSGTPKITFER
jgi:hypothetical protein